MKCGHCKSLDVTVDHVRACADFTGAPDPKPQPVAVVNGPTDKQIAFITKLLAEKEHDVLDVDGFIATQRTLNRKSASVVIELLMDKPKKAKTNVHTTLVDGIYTKDGAVYRVYHTVHGANQQVVSLLNPEGATKKDKFTYLGKAPLAFLTAADQMTFEEAKGLCSAYEFCIACGTILHNDKSVELGIGPVCRGKFA
jgi:hypothetical protein